MTRYCRPALVLLTTCFLTASGAEESPRVSIVSRDAASLRVEAEGFATKSDRALAYRVHFAGSIVGGTRPLPEGPFEIPTRETGVYTLTIVSQKSADEGSDVKGK